MHSVARANASGAITPLNAESPRRTISLARSSGSTCPSAATRAISRWIEFVPTSRAAIFTGIVIVTLVQRWWQRVRSPFDPNRADENGLVGIGGSLDPELVLVAYRSGVFPWSSQPVISWWSPDPRAIFDLDTYKPHRSTQKSVRRGGWRFSVDEAFEPVMRACAEPATGRESTWISEDFVRTYVKLHARGHAHSVEVWDGRDLVGGLYGVTLGGFFGGESMFSRRTDASKAAVMHLIEI